MKMVWKATFFVFLAAVPGFAMAEEAPEQHDDVEAAIDEPEEKVTPEQLKKLHAKMDADADGKVSTSEFWNFSYMTQLSSEAKQAAEIMPEMDGDSDGKLSLDEVFKSYYGEREEFDHEKARDGEKFGAADTNSDGLLDLKEFTSFAYPYFHDNVLPTVARHHVQDADEDGDGLLAIDEFMGKLAGVDKRSAEDLQTFKKIDKDGSGKLDEQELMPWVSGHFQKKQDMKSFMQLADTNSDQHVTLEELDAVHGKEHHAHDHFNDMVRHHEL